MLKYSVGDCYMLKKIGFFAIAAVFSSNLMAMNQDVAPNFNLNYSLQPNSPEPFYNIQMSPVHIDCQYKTREPSVSVEVVVLKRGGELDDRVIKEGDAFTVMVENGSKMKIMAQAGAQVQLTNKGNFPIDATCSIH